MRFFIQRDREKPREGVNRFTHGTQGSLSSWEGWPEGETLPAATKFFDSWGEASEYLEKNFTKNTGVKVVADEECEGASELMVKLDEEGWGALSEEERRCVKEDLGDREFAAGKVLKKAQSNLFYAEQEIEYIRRLHRMSLIKRGRSQAGDQCHEL